MADDVEALIGALGLERPVIAGYAVFSPASDSRGMGLESACGPRFSFYLT